MTAHSTTIAMLLADSRLPAGSHVSSNGLEAALRAGLPPARVPEYLATRMGTVVLVEAGTAVVARSAVASGGGTTALRAVEREWAARTPSAAVREVSRALGAGLARLARELWPDTQIWDPLASAPVSRPVVLGACAAIAGLAADDLVRLVAYDDAQTVTAAMLKLEPLDPRIPTRWALEAAAAIESQVALLAALTLPEAIPVAGAPQTEEWAESHTHLTRRLFRV